jgi:hypothetical protein
MSIMYKTSCITKEDVGINFISDYKTKVQQSHGLTLNDAIGWYCNDLNINMQEYYETCKDKRKE